MSLLKLLLLLEARKSTAESSDEGLSIWEGSDGFALVDFNGAMINLSQVPTPFLANTFRKVRGQLAVPDYERLCDFLQSRCKISCAEMFYKSHPDGLKVGSVAAEKGYGPTLYYILGKKSPTGFIVSDYNVRPSALDVWQRFYDNPKVPKKQRSDLSAFKKEVPEVLKYAYKVIDSKTNLRRLRNEYKIGLQDFKEQLQERLEEIYPDTGDLSGYVDRLKIEDAIEGAAEIHFRANYDKPVVPKAAPAPEPPPPPPPQEPEAELEWE